MLSRLLVLAILIYAVPQSYAGVHEYQRGSDLPEEGRSISSINEIIPELDTLQGTPKCGGDDGCQQFKDLDNCLDVRTTLRCFWSNE